MSKGVNKVFRDGQWQEGKAAPWLPPEQMRGLPASWTTKDTSDPDRIHELDAPHVVDSLVHDQLKKETADSGTLPESVLEKYDLWDGPFDQLHIDIIKFRAIRNLIGRAKIEFELGNTMSLKKLHHLWFPKAKLDPRELREGRPPLRFDRPEHLRDKDLIVDVYNWPRRIVDMLKAKGIDVPDVAELERQMCAPKTLVLQ